jgi:hypothetical protein
MIVIVTALRLCLRLCLRLFLTERQHSSANDEQAPYCTRGRSDSGCIHRRSRGCRHKRKRGTITTITTTTTITVNFNVTAIFVDLTKLATHNGIISYHNCEATTYT